MKKINNRGGSEIRMTAFEMERDKRSHGREGRVDRTVISRLARESRVTEV